MSRRRLLLGAAAVLIVAGGGLAPAPASAAGNVAPDDAGWWWRPQDESLPAPLPPPPYVEEGELLVQGAPDGAMAMAALRFSLPDDQAASPVLTLTVKDGGDQGGEQADVLACVSGAGWTGAHAGVWQEKPLADCSASVQGLRSEDGTTWTFAVAPLQTGTTLDVVVVPGEGSVFQLVFEEPDATVLETGSGGAASFEPPPPAAFGSAGGTDGFATSGPPSTSFSAPSSTSPTPAPAGRPALSPEEQGSSAIAPGARAANPAPVPVAATTGDNGRAVGVLLLVVGVGAAFYASRQPVTPVQGVGRFARTPATGATAGPVAAGPVVTGAAAPVTTGGLGRFARPRTGPPPRLT